MVFWVQLTHVGTFGRMRGELQRQPKHNKVSLQEVRLRTIHSNMAKMGKVTERSNISSHASL